MKQPAVLFLLSLAVATAASVDAEVQTRETPGSSGLRLRIAELVKQDALKLSAKPAEPALPAPADPTDVAPEETVPPEVLELEPFTVTKKRELVLPPVPKLTLENFFYGDGMMARKGRVSLSAGPERRGLAAIKFTIKF